LPPMLAIAAWMVISFFACAFSLLLIGRELGITLGATGVLATALACLLFAPTQTFFITGQLSLILMLPMTLAWLDARHGRWGRAGVWLGACLAVKPFVLIFMPYLAITRRTRALITALRTSVVCFVVGVAIFGLENYRSWFRAMVVSSDWAWASMNASVLALFLRVFGTTPYFAPVWLRPALVVGWIVIAGVIGIATLIVVIRDRSAAAVDRAFALLLVAAQLVSPLGWVYYLWLPAGPVAMLVANRSPYRLFGIRDNAVLLMIATAGLFIPPTALFMFQPRPWATVIVGSAYFWATFSLWVWLLTGSQTSRSDVDVS
jgi:hypothetical protein